MLFQYYLFLLIFINKVHSPGTACGIPPAIFLESEGTAILERVKI